MSRFVPVRIRLKKFSFLLIAKGWVCLSVFTVWFALINFLGFSFVCMWKIMKIFTRRKRK